MPNAIIEGVRAVISTIRRYASKNRVGEFGIDLPGGFIVQAAALQGEVRMDVNRRIKQARAPNGIIAPGKSVADTSRRGLEASRRSALKVFARLCTSPGLVPSIGSRSADRQDF